MATFDVHPTHAPTEVYTVVARNVTCIRPVYAEIEDVEDANGVVGVSLLSPPYTEILMVNTIGPQSSMVVLESPRKVKEYLEDALRRG